MMVKLAKREEQIMQVFWELNEAFIKEVIPNLPDPTALQQCSNYCKNIRRKRFSGS